VPGVEGVGWRGRGGMGGKGAAQGGETTQALCAHMNNKN
jgi:hypothetical protein